MGNTLLKFESVEIVTGTGDSVRAERHEQLLPVSKIEHAQRFQDYCRTCPHYAKNLACPPNTPYFTSYVGKARTAHVICLRIPLAGSQSAPEQQKSVIREVSKYLGEELRGYLKQGCKVAGSGYCRACEICAAEIGKTTCIKPKERIFSLEAMGVDVNALLKASFGFGLEWNKGAERANYLCVVGAIFYDEKLTSVNP